MPEYTVTLLFGIGLGAAVCFFLTRRMDRKIEALVPGGIKAWEAWPNNEGPKPQ